MSKRILIVGNGISGVSAGTRLRELDPRAQISLISGESRHHYSRPALMYLFMGHMKFGDAKPYEDRFWVDQRIDLVKDWVVGIDVDRQVARLRAGTELDYDDLVLATGSVSNRFGWPGQDLDGVHGLYDLFDLRGISRSVARTRRAVLVGGGLIGIELAEMLLSRGISVTFLVRERSFWDIVLPSEESALINDVIRRHGIDLRLETELKEIIPGADGRVAAVRTISGERIDCEFVGLTVGVSPNKALAVASGVPCARGILADRRLQTDVPHVWAAGDCAEIRTGEERNLLQQVWYTGRFQGRHAAECIYGSKAPYTPGVWFNSAKFFDVEYQTYGSVNRDLPGEESFFWKHPDLDVCIRIVHVGGRVVGFNCMGMRLRHRVCEKWILQAAELGAVTSDLGAAAFDPEFFADHVSSFTRAWAREGIRA